MKRPLIGLSLSTPAPLPPTAFPTLPLPGRLPLCAGLQVEFSLLAAAQVPVQGSLDGLGELALHLRGRAREEHSCPSPSAEQRGQDSPSPP